MKEPTLSDLRLKITLLENILQTTIQCKECARYVRRGHCGAFGDMNECALADQQLMVLGRKP